jgi:hypothetical protein
MFVRGEAGHAKWCHKRNEDILMELRIEPVTDCITKKTAEDVNRMNARIFPKAMVGNRPDERRSMWRQMEVWRELVRT